MVQDKKRPVVGPFNDTKKFPGGLPTRGPTIFAENPERSTPDLNPLCTGARFLHPCRTLSCQIRGAIMSEQSPIREPKRRFLPSVGASQREPSTGGFGTADLPRFFGPRLA